MLPSDVTGTMTLRGGELAFRPGPVFTSVLLADEINRTPPKTQAALLEAMEERQVTIEGEPRPLPDPFLVIATQNPIEYEGTYPLPEAQLDRFLFKLELGYPDEEVERPILDLPRIAASRPATLDDVQPVVDASELARAAREVDATGVSDEVADYVVDRARARGRCRASSSARARARASTCWPPRRRVAWLDDRSFVTPDDVAAIAPAVLRHRLLLHPEAELERYRADDAVRAALQPCPFPGDARRRARRCSLALVAVGAARSCRAAGRARCSRSRSPRRPARRARRAPAARGRARRAGDPLARRARAAPRSTPAEPGAIRLRQPRAARPRARPGEADGELDGELVARRRGRHVLPAPALARTRAARARLPGTAGRRGGRGRSSTPDLPAARRLALAVRAGASATRAARAGRSGSARSSSRCATTCPTTTSARSTGARPRASAGR